VEAASVLHDQIVQAAPPEQTDTTQEIAEFQSMQPKAPDGIAVETVAPPALTAPLSQAVSKKIPIVAVDSAPVSGSNVTAFVGNDNIAIGYSMAKVLIQKIPKNKKGEVVFGNPVPNLPLLQDRIKGMQEALRKYRPGLTFSQVYAINPSPSGALASYSQLASEFPNAVAFMGPGDQIATVFPTISRETHKHYLVGGCDVDPQALKGVKEGYVDVIGDPEHFMKGYLAIWALTQHAQGKPLFKGWLNSGNGVITSANINSILHRETSNAARYAWYKSRIQSITSNLQSHIKPIADAN
jgi:ribose transport system substrate-binding protein